MRIFQLKVAPRFELGMGALQAPALPLGYATILAYANPVVTDWRYKLRT